MSERSDLARDLARDLGQLRKVQSGVVARRQLLDHGLSRPDVARMLRRTELVAHLPGVYLDHNGPPTWEQRAWAGVLHAWPAALCLSSAVRAVEGSTAARGASDVVHVAVARGRHLAPVPGLRIHRWVGFPDRVQWNASPPRIRYDEAVLDLALAAADDVAAVAVLADACGSRRTTADRLQARLAERARVGRRTWLDEVLADVAAGTCSTLEHGYLERVVRPHGLPEGRRQAPGVGATGRVWRDVEVDDLSMAVELDGVLHHASAQAHARDLDRDLVAAADADLLTLRLGWTQVFVTGCRTASYLGRLMQRRGWSGTPTACPECA